MQAQTLLALTSAQKVDADKLVKLVQKFPDDAQKTIFGIVAGFRVGMEYQEAHSQQQAGSPAS